jgi:AAA family ATPase
VQISCGYSGAEIVSVCNDAALLALDSNAEHVSEKMLLQACQKITPQITKEMLHFYEGFRSKYRTF